ncbi:unnamed protein product [Pleuronectes platessa]|uniref:Uncharacterized protein n=1 Tax=Pleuronectes platessa TaxID=8262 RepID=A0A9N7V9X8_PLEPL|nr:platelet glycoprotein V [Pleuronectes platessa]CAB1444729.1 unnamed protein product [Pleuronectes platessa]
MDSCFRGPLWITLILFMRPHCSYSSEGRPVCPRSCDCSYNNVVLCTGDMVQDIPKEMPPQTYEVYLNNTNMNVINDQSLKNLDFMQRFGLTHSHLHTIRPLAFHVAPKLRFIKLSSNNLTTLPSLVFSPLTILEQLFLDGNQLETISPEIFHRLVKLQVLDLGRNKLIDLPPDVFDGLTELAYLNLARNRLKRLSPTIFHSLVNLLKLYMYNNRLEALESKMFDALVNLQELLIDHNQIARLPRLLFHPLTNLTSLTLSSNQLQAVPQETFYNMPKLRKLTLYNNPLLSLPPQLMGHMPEMRELYLYNTKLTTVPGNLFSNMSGLLMLHLHLNHHLRELPADLFCCLPQLRKLSLKYNDLHYLHPQLFSKLTSLNMLVLSGNSLQNLTKNLFQGLEELQTIDLKDNYLKTLPGDIFLSNEALGTLTLIGNPWDCTCSIRGIARWIRSNARVVIDKGNVTCRSPSDKRHRTLASLQDQEFSYCDVSTEFPGKKNLPASAQPFHAISTSRSASTTTPPATPSSTSEVIKPQVFHGRLVIEQGPEYVHHNHHRGWVLVWFLPSDTAWAGFLMFCHILLATTGLFLILAAMYTLCRLDKTMDKLKAECT